MHYYKINNEIMHYSIVGNDIALIMHYRALLKRSEHNKVSISPSTLISSFKKRGRKAAVLGLEESNF